jgi:surface antigen
MRCSSFKITASLLLVGGLLGGCATKGDAPARGIFSPRPAAATPYITALQGGIISRSGLDISGSDRARALEAEYRALEASPGGQPVTWSGSDVKGEVVASAPYQVGTQNCRQYRHTLTAEGREVTARGAACRNSDGSWTPLT